MNKNLTYNDIKNSKTGINALETIVDWNDLQLTIKDRLSFEEMMLFFNDVVKLCFSEETGEYLPQIKNFALDYCTIQYYSNIAMPDDINEAYDMIYSTNLVEVIKHHIKYEQLFAIVIAVDKKLDHISSANIEKTNEQISEIINMFEGLEKNMSEIFDGIDGDTLQSLASALVDGKFDEDKLVSAIARSVGRDNSDA